MRGVQSRQGRDWLDRAETVMRLVNRAFAALSCILVLVIMTLIVVAVFYRYVLDDPIAWVLDITIFLLVFVFFLALAPALESGSHIEVDMFDPLIPRAWRKPVRMAGKLLTLIFAAIFFWFVLAYYRDIVELDELSFTMITVQLKLVYWIGPIGAWQFLFTALVLFIRFCREPLAIDDEAAADAH
jgi:TRAP-type C4-dicarboxylate transport system permease small subunit